MIALKFLETEIHTVLTRLLGHDIDVREAAKDEVSRLIANVGPMILAEALGSSVPPAAAPVVAELVGDVVEVAANGSTEIETPIAEEVTASTSTPEEAPTQMVEEVAQPVEEVVPVQEGPEDDGDGQKQE